jgi:hypothetical protein
MKYFLCFLFAFAIVSPVHGDIGKAASQGKKEEECLNQLEERNAAFGAHDWSQLDLIARRLIQTCTAVLDRREISLVYADLAMANNQRGLFREALAAAQSGITTHYLVTENHVEQFRSLLSLHRLDEARSSFQTTERLVKRAIDQNNKDLSNAADERYRELYTAKGLSYQAQLDLLEKYRPEIK